MISQNLPQNLKMIGHLYETKGGENSNVLKAFYFTTKSTKTISHTLGNTSMKMWMITVMPSILPTSIAWNCMSRKWSAFIFPAQCHGWRILDACTRFYWIRSTLPSHSLTTNIGIRVIPYIYPTYDNPVYFVCAYVYSRCYSLKTVFFFFSFFLRTQIKESSSAETWNITKKSQVLLCDLGFCS